MEFLSFFLYILACGAIVAAFLGIAAIVLALYARKRVEFNPEKTALTHLSPSLGEDLRVYV